MHNRTRGFTLVEVVIVVLVGSILATIAFNALSGVQGRFAARQARNTFGAFHAQARAQAIEFGETTRLLVDMTGDSAWIVRGGATVEVFSFRRTMDVDVRGSSTSLRLCMNPRGFADTGCNSFTSTQTVVFAAGSDTASVQIRTLGQLVY